jgi:hypothetical protein
MKRSGYIRPTEGLTLGRLLETLLPPVVRPALAASALRRFTREKRLYMRTAADGPWTRFVID